MRITFVLAALLITASCDSAVADTVRSPRPPASANARFALSATLSPVAVMNSSANSRFVLAVGLDAVKAAPPGNSRYTLVSRLGDPQTLGTCNGTLPDPLFRNGFEN